MGGAGEAGREEAERKVEKFIQEQCLDTSRERRGIGWNLTKIMLWCRLEDGTSKSDAHCNIHRNFNISVPIKIHQIAPHLSRKHSNIYRP